MKAMILAAGQGTRLRPLTDNIPKPLVKFKGVPLLEIIIKRLLHFGIEQIVVNVHHMAEQVLEFLDHKRFYGGRILVSDEIERLMDTGGGVLKARQYLDTGKPFLLHNVDVYTNLDLRKLIDFHQSGDSLMTIAVKKRSTSRLLLFDDKKCLVGWKHNQTGEKRIIRDYEGNPEDYGNSCIYVISPEFYRLVHNTEPVSLTEIYLHLAKDHEIKAFIHNQDYWYNLGLYESFLKAETAVKNNTYGIW